MSAWEIDLLTTKKSMLVGDIGEAVAVHWLRDNGFIVITKIIKLFDGKIKLIGTHTVKMPAKWGYESHLSKKQKEYLAKAPFWDLVAFNQREQAFRFTPYLIEVKTVRGNKRPHKTHSAVQEAKAVGFKTLQLIVKLLGNWKIRVEVRKL